MTNHPQAVVIGMMGAGKTRVGRETAQLMGLPFLDADVEIERQVGMSIPEYFERYGEPAFREVESDLIRRTVNEFDGIFSLGGGAPMTPAVRECLAEYVSGGGKVIYLMADPREAMERARRGGAGRCSTATPTNGGSRCTRCAIRCSGMWRMWWCIPTVCRRRRRQGG